MGARTMGAMAQVNAALRKAGRAERLVRGRGYYYLHKGETGRFPSTAIYSYRLEAEDGPSTKRDVADLFKAAGIEVTL